VMSGAYRDGSPGVAVASLSAIGDYLGMLERWDREGRPSSTRLRGRERLMVGMGRLAYRAQWRARRLARRA
jgi:hypothetical protein